MIQIDTLRKQNMQKPWSERTLFISGRVSLDFAQSGGEGPYAVFERLRTPRDLVVWFAMSSLSLTGTAATTVDLRHARKLRQAIWRVANAMHEDKSVAAEELTVINKAATRLPLVPVLINSGRQQIWRQPATAKAALATIARDAIELFSHNESLPIQQCSGAKCPLLFVDRSRSHKRKWCAMERCGNLAKAAKYRSRDGLGRAI